MHSYDPVPIAHEPGWRFGKIMSCLVAIIDATDDSLIEREPAPGFVWLDSLEMNLRYNQSRTFGQTN